MFDNTAHFAYFSSVERQARRETCAPRIAVGRGKKNESTYSGSAVFVEASTVFTLADFGRSRVFVGARRSWMELGPAYSRVLTYV